MTGTKIAIVTPRYKPHIGGVEKHVTEVAEGLVKRNISVDIITTDPTGLLPPTEEIEGVNIRRFRTIGNDSVFFISPTLASWLNQHAGQYDLLHAHSYHTPLALQTAFAARKYRIPFVVTPHYHGSGHSNFRQLLHIPYRIPGNWMINQANLIVCVSEAEQTLIHKHFGASLPTTVIPNGVDLGSLLEAEPFPREGNSKLILSAGRLEHYKQVSKLAQAMPLLPKEYHLAITGKGPASEELANIVRDLHLENRVRLLGYVSQEDLWRWFKTADVYVSISKHEAFGISLLEGAVGGAKVIASSIPAHHEVSQYLGEGSSSITFVDPDCTISELAEAVVKAEARSYSHNTVQHELPTWDQVVDKLVDKYNLILSQERIIAAS